MTGLPPWLSVAAPRTDIADGSFDESLFAADLGLVDRGRGPADYLDPVAFCEKTYLTTSLREVLGELARRLAGDAAAARRLPLADRVRRGQDPHAARRLPPVPRSRASRGRGLGSRAAEPQRPRRQLPKAKVVVIDGSAIPAGSPDPTPDGIELHTPARPARLPPRRPRRIREPSRRRTRACSVPGPAQLPTLLEAHAPCLILLDETLEYLNKALSVPIRRRQPRSDNTHADQGTLRRRRKRPQGRRSRDTDQLPARGLRHARRRGDAGAALEGRRPLREHRHAGRRRRHLPDPPPPAVRRPSVRTASADDIAAAYGEYYESLGRRAAPVVPGAQLPRADHRRLPVPSRARRHPHQSLGVSLGLPAHPRCAADPRPHGQEPRPAPRARPTDPSGRRRSRRCRHPR